MNKIIKMKNLNGTATEEQYIVLLDAIEMVLRGKQYGLYEGDFTDTEEEKLNVFKEMITKFKSIHIKNKEDSDSKFKEYIEAFYSTKAPENVELTYIKPLPFNKVPLPTKVTFDFCIGDDKDIVTVEHDYLYYDNEDEKIRTQVLSNALINYVVRRCTSICKQKNSNCGISWFSEIFLEGYSENNLDNEKDDIGSNKTI